LQRSVTVGILKFTRKFLTMVCLGMILMHNVGNGKEGIPRAERSAKYGIRFHRVATV